MLTALFSLICLLSPPELAVTTSEPGNVFFAGRPVQVQIKCPEGTASSLTFRLADYEGQAVPVRNKPDPTGILDLTTLPRGYYELSVSDGSREVTVPLVVVAKPRPSRTGRLAVDAAHSWLIPPDKFEEGAELVRRAGFTRARERLSWPEVEPQRGHIVWGKYDAAIDAAHKRGIDVYQVFHASPAWARTDHSSNRYPDDLRDVFNFCKAAAYHYRGRVRVWEVWNEADISVFSPEPGSEYAAFLKAAYLGFNAGDPRTKVTQVSLAMAAPKFHESLYKNGSASYFDIFNWHIYDRPEKYADRARGHLGIMDRARVPAVPIWLTEAGIPLKAMNNTLTAADKRRQAEFIPKSCVMSLASGSDKHFFFVFPHYLENGIEFGTLDAGMKPYPGYAALATVTEMLGDATYLGKLICGADVDARLFDNGSGHTLVLWSDRSPSNVRLPIRSDLVRMANCVGSPLKVPLAGELSLDVGSSPIYIRAPRGAFGSYVNDRVSRQNPGPAARHSAQNLVLRIRPPTETFHKQEERYVLDVGQSVSLGIEVYNFGRKPLEGQIRFTPPAGWTLAPATFRGRFGPMGRQVFQAVLTAPTDSGAPTVQLKAEIVPPPGQTWEGSRWGSISVAIDLRLR